MQAEKRERRPRAERVLLPAVLALLVGLIPASVQAVEDLGNSVGLTDLPAGFDEGSSAESYTPDLRRWEHVLQVNVALAGSDPIGRAELAAMDAGGAVLDRVKTDGNAQVGVYRMLVRTRTKSPREVLAAVQRVRGVISVSAAALPETLTYPGSPDFVSSYTGELGDDSGHPRALVRHDVPEVLDKRDLLETTAIPGATLVPDSGVGGVGLNISEMVKRIRERSWHRREQRMKNAYLPILPPS